MVKVEYNVKVGSTGSEDGYYKINNIKVKAI